MSVSGRTDEVYYTEDELEKAKQNNNALKYALSRGYQLQKSGNEYHLKEHDSMVFTLDGKWHWNSKDLHGHALDFIQAYENYNFKEAICLLAGTLNKPPLVGPVINIPLPSAEKKGFILPEKAENYKVIFAYLKERGIDQGLVKNLVGQHKIYQGITYNKLEIVGYDKDGQARYTYKPKDKPEFVKAPYERVAVNNGEIGSEVLEKDCFVTSYVNLLAASEKVRQYNSLIMVGHDGKNAPRYASQRSTGSFGKPFKVDVAGSDKSYPFIIDGKAASDTVRVFESPIEAMSYWSLCKETESCFIQDYMISKGGSATFVPLDRFLNEHSEVKNIILCLNNDSQEFGHEINAGLNATENLSKRYQDKYNVGTHIPHLNDWNDVLKNYRHNLEGKMNELRLREVKSKVVSKSRSMSMER